MMCTHSNCNNAKGIQAKQHPSSQSHPRRLAPVLAGIHCVCAQLLLNAHQLVVLCIAIGAAWSPGLDLATAETNSNVCDGDILCLARAVRAHHTPSILLA